MDRRFSSLFLVLALFLPIGLPAGADIANNGTFAFLTEALPDGTTNAQYAARLVTVNADGPVTFIAQSALPTGITLDPLSGFITGLPTQVFNDSVSIIADDTTQQVGFSVTLKINAAGGGGNGGAGFGNTALADGQVGSVYADMLTIAGGVGPFTYGAKDLPPGVALNGQTGVLSGNPSTPGRYFVTLSAYDEGENNNAATVLPLLVLPSGSTFAFVTQSLNNGEVGTPFCDAYLVQGATGPVTFTTSGLPPGITLDPATGIASGTPTAAGTFEVVIRATDGQDTLTTNLGMLIVPSSTSNFYWNVFSLPTALLNTPYDRQPPIEAATVNGSTSVTYAASGLPSGLAYNATTGELTGTPAEIGEFDTVFTATDAMTTEVLTLEFRFVVLPVTGGDIGSTPVNFWLAKQKLKLGDDGEEAWAGGLLFNIDRRTGMGFDSALDAISLTLGSRTLDFPAGLLEGTNKSLAYKSPKGVLPTEAIKLSLAKQTLKWASKNDTLDATAPGVHLVVLKLGSSIFRTNVRFDEKAKASALSSVRPAFIVAKGKLGVGFDGEDAAKLSMLLGDESFLYETGDTLRIRILEGTTVLVDRDFTALGEGQSATDKSGKLIFRLKTIADTEVTDVIKKFSYKSDKGKLSLALSGMSLGALTNGEAHVTVELTIGDRAYTTSVTLFGKNPGKYSTSMP